MGVSFTPNAMRPLVLVADDSEDVRAMVCAILGRAGFRTVQAEDGAEAVDLTRARRPAVVLMDVAMPGMDGIAAAQTIVGDPACRGVRVVLFTAMHEVVELAAAVGLPVIGKPADRHTILRFVERALATP
jgi:CheY-like chemotaxis protein